MSQCSGNLQAPSLKLREDAVLAAVICRFSRHRIVGGQEEEEQRERAGEGVGF